jgi:hypothetical protein
MYGLINFRFYGSYNDGETTTQRSRFRPLSLACEGRVEGFGSDRRLIVARLTARTPHPAGFAGHLLPQGEKGVVTHRLAVLLLRRLRAHRGIVQHRREPAFDLFDRHAFAGRIVLDLIALDFGDAKIMRLRMGDVEAGDR